MHLDAEGVVGALALGLVPAFADFFVVLQLTLYMAYAVLALSLAFVWGYGGMFSFGQAAFFGLGGYTYAVVGLNAADTTIAIIAAVLLPMAFAAVLGYFMIYGRISDIYLKTCAKFDALDVVACASLDIEESHAEGRELDVAHGLERHANEKGERIAPRAHERLHGHVARNVVRDRGGRGCRPAGHLGRRDTGGRVGVRPRRLASPR